MSELTVTVGIDWSERHLDACVVDTAGRVLGEKRFDQSVAGMVALTEWIARHESDPTRVGIAIELKHGAVVGGLMERGFRLATINPKQVDRFRDRFSVSGAKDDRRDARVLADSLRTDVRAFRWIEPEDPLIVELRECTRAHDDLIGLQVADSNRLRDQLLRYFPAAVELAGDDLAKPWFLELISSIPTREKARLARAAGVDKVLRRHRIRRLDAKQVLETLRSPALEVSPAAAIAASRSAQQVVERLRIVSRQIADNLRRIDALVEQIAAQESQPGRESEQLGVQVLQSLPGVGRTTCAKLLAEASQLLRRRDYPALRVLTGVAPVTKRSGNRRLVTMRRACNTNLREAMHHAARGAVQHYDYWAAFYARLRDKGLTPGHAYRRVADKLLAVTVAALRDGTLYDESKLRPAP